MKKKRLIPILLLQNGSIVKSKKFCRYQRLGNPVTSVQRLSEWASDELIYLDITKEGAYDLGRDDLAFNNCATILEIIKDVSLKTFMPITVGGGIRTLSDIEKRLKVGADKVCVNSKALEESIFINQAAKEFGSQCIVSSIDYVYREGQPYIYNHVTKSTMHLKLIDWAQKVCDMGAGELFVNAVDRDGTLEGYDIDTLNQISEKIPVPIIACGGAGEFEHFAQLLRQTKVDACGAANIFHYSDQSVYLAKKYLYEQGLPVRNPELLKIELEEKHALL